MQNKLTSLLLVLFIATGFSQSRADLMVATKKLYQANYNMSFEEIVTLSYPKIVETIGKEAMLEKLDLRHQNEEFRLRLQLEIVPFQFGPIKSIEGKSYCVVTYRNPIRYFFENKLSPEAAIEKTAWLKEINQTKEVTFEPNRNSFNVKKISNFVAIADETTYTEWRFFNLDDANQKEIFDTIFNENVKKNWGCKKYFYLYLDLKLKLTLKTHIMAKSQDAKKTEKKEPLKTAKEKKAEKREKKNSPKRD